MEDKQRQELHCHACNHYVQFELDLSLNGNHVLKCPTCGHEHCRVVCDGKITAGRWDQRNSFVADNSTPTFFITTMSSSATSVYDNMGLTSNAASTGAVFLADAWLNSDTSTVGVSTYTTKVV